jgi:hypothetical protein
VESNEGSLRRGGRFAGSRSPLTEASLSKFSSPPVYQNSGRPGIPVSGRPGRAAAPSSTSPSRCFGHLGPH